SSPVAIPASDTSGPADPYGLPIVVSGVRHSITKVRVTLSGLSHTFPSDIEVLLVGPEGQTVVLMSDAGDGFPIDNADLTFDDGAGALPDAAQIVSGTYRPTQY